MSKLFHSRSVTLSPLKRLWAFTLIELLVVVAIIALLAGLSFPAAMKALEATKKAKALALMQRVKVGLTSYKAEYDVWPPALNAYTNANGDIFISTNSWGPLVCSLAGYTNDPTGYVTNGTVNNSRVIKYLDFPSDCLSANTSAPFNNGCTDFSQVQNLIDPWMHPYQMLLDGNYDNQLVGVPDITSTNSSATVNLQGDIAIWSQANVTTPNQYVVTWK